VLETRLRSDAHIVGKGSWTGYYGLCIDLFQSTSRLVIEVFLVFVGIGILYTKYTS